MLFNLDSLDFSQLIAAAQKHRVLATALSLCALFFTLCGLAGCLADLGLGKRPQDPGDRPYNFETVRFSGGAGVTLEGEVTVPNGEGPHKAVILISGSGPQNRNEELGGHRPFLVLADHLTRAGYAVLRYDDRGTGESTGVFAGATVHDFAQDAVGAFSYLQSRQDIDPKSIGFLGHSEGGYIAPAAARFIDPAFMVFLAGPARPFIDVLAQQAADIHVAEGGTIKEGEIAQKHFLRAKQILVQDKPKDQIRTEIAVYLLSQGIGASEQETHLDFIMDPWVLAYAKYDTRRALRKLDLPVFALFGTTDLQVSAAQEAPAMRESLRHPKSLVEVFAGLNHLFQPSETGLPSEYEDIETTISPSVLKRIVEWLDAL